ncbi:MAG: SWF/SNF helicase family protein, partial [Lentisphaeraceae bacterium]|nr:SWF/SNF helicase family protein [Lentisphaeraceae bacterium]
LQSLLEQICSQGEHKLLIFSEWIRMLDKIEEVLNIQEITFVRIDGNSSARQKEQALQHFNNQPEIQVLLCSSTAGVGLNLQEADTLINVDIPWNPATMEQRIARAHRYGQTKPVQAINLVTAGTIEERLLANFEKKQELFSAVLDPETDICEVSMSSGMGDLRSKLQGLLTSPSKKSHHRETVIALPGVSAEVMSLSGGRLMNSALNFLGDLLQTQGGTDAPEGLSREIRRLLLNAFQRNEKGELEITLRFADDEAVDRLAVSLARMTSMLRG